MPLIQPITPAPPMRAAAKTDMEAYTQPVPATNAATQPSDNETGDKAVAPAAPPSALQMQIQALISEQVEVPGQASEDYPDGAT